MSDARSWMIHSFEDILFKGLIKQLANQWIGSWISLNDSLGSLPHARRLTLTQKCNRKFKSIKSVEDVALDLQSIESKSAKAIVC